MVLLVIERFDAAAFEALFLGIPESLGLLIFGFGLVTAAVLIRRVLAKSEIHKTEEKNT